ncbi:hypothetical protein BS639_20935 [Rouxiella silvae]|uniref:Uncharacterized protein n=1 Tax=Rouxiella silvae TaxID=1646373 RepID=A0ABX3TVL6_9GAMM|nr:hypothetical protein [Rouxiella silvae]ORJ19269.1 hypothetical protein BS639_20935 [Rouxiella silvae]
MDNRLNNVSSTRPVSPSIQNVNEPAVPTRLAVINRVANSDKLPGIVSASSDVPQPLISPFLPPSVHNGNQYHTYTVPREPLLKPPLPTATLASNNITHENLAALDLTSNSGPCRASVYLHPFNVNNASNFLSKPAAERFGIYDAMDVMVREIERQQAHPIVNIRREVRTICVAFAMEIPIYDERVVHDIARNNPAYFEPLNQAARHFIYAFIQQEALKAPESWR